MPFNGLAGEPELTKQVISSHNAANSEQLHPQVIQNPDATVRPQVAIVRWDEADTTSIASLFENKGYLVSFHTSRSWFATENYGAVIHTARSAGILERNFEIFPTYSGDEEMALIARDDIDDIHCLVKLTNRATPSLRNYVRNLWAMCNMT
jgi:hypothetical protein